MARKKPDATTAAPAPADKPKRTRRAASAPTATPAGEPLSINGEMHQPGSPLHTKAQAK